MFKEYASGKYLLVFTLLGPTTKKKKLDWDTRVQIALGAAQGLAYLHHDCSPRIIHRDVKSSNILLDKDFEAHLTDFGIAKSLCISKTHTSTCVMGTIGYIDPEYARTSRLTEKSDVYSYGIVLLELLTGRKAVDNECNLHHLVSLHSFLFNVHNPKQMLNHPVSYIMLHISRSDLIQDSEQCCDGNC